MTPFETFEMYVALKQHFNQTTYDFIKYNGKTKLKFSQFQNRRDKYYFEKLSRHEDPKGFLISNLVNNSSFWIGELTNNQVSQQIYFDWKKRNQSLEYMFCQSVKQLLDNNTIEQLIKIPPNGYPALIISYLQKQISIEVLVIITDCIRCFNYWNKNMKDDIVWQSVGRLIHKYKPFINYDPKKYNTQLKKMLTISKET